MLVPYLDCSMGAEKDPVCPALFDSQGDPGADQEKGHLGLLDLRGTKAPPPVPRPGRDILRAFPPGPGGEGGAGGVRVPAGDVRSLEDDAGDKGSREVPGLRGRKGGVDRGGERGDAVREVLWEGEEER